MNYELENALLLARSLELGIDHSRKIQLSSKLRKWVLHKSRNSAKASGVVISSSSVEVPTECLDTNKL